MTLRGQSAPACGSCSRELLAEVAKAPRIGVAASGEPDLLLRVPIWLVLTAERAVRAGTT